MPRQVTVVTPENVRIDYELAGIASRAAAAIADTLVQGLLLALVAAVRRLLVANGVWPGSTWAAALLGIAVFIVFWGYYMFFETLWSGQTPGKRYARLRVVGTGGTPISLPQAAVRNLVRIIDFIPIPYVVGVITILVTSRCQRLGDLAAGTLVVKERGGQAAPLPNGSAAAVKEGPCPHLAISIELVTPEEFEAVKRYVDRKAELSGHVREEIAARIARPLIERLAIANVDGIRCSDLLTEIYLRCVSHRGMC